VIKCEKASLYLAFGRYLIFSVALGRRPMPDTTEELGKRPFLFDNQQKKGYTIDISERGLPHEEAAL